MSSKSAEIQERLKMSHLDTSEEELKETISAATKRHAPSDGREPGDDPKDQEVYPFTLNWKDRRGKVWHGKFESHMLTIGEKLEQGILQATLQGGMPWEAFSPYHRDLITAISHMTYSLKERPRWAKDLRGLKDDQLILAMFGEVASHEATFWGDGADQEEGGEEEPDGGERA